MIQVTLVEAYAQRLVENALLTSQVKTSIAAGRAQMAIWLAVAP